MHRLSVVVAAVTLAALTLTTTAHAEAPTVLPSMNSLMTVLDVLGLVEKGAPSVSALTHVHVRKPTWLSPDPPKTPLLYSSVVVAKF